MLRKVEPGPVWPARAILLGMGYALIISAPAVAFIVPSFWLWLLCIAVPTAALGAVLVLASSGLLAAFAVWSRARAYERQHYAAVEALGYRVSPPTAARIREEARARARRELLGDAR
jgi:hypothetical protein